VVAAALIRQDGCVLLQRRRSGAAHGGLWEFPGGKVETDETPEEALLREISEELGLTIDRSSLAPLTFASDPVAAPQVRVPHLILLYGCTRWTGTPAPLAADAIAWYNLQMIGDLPMPPLDLALVATLKSRI
jgi:8-oxo-dGTP diphosphatase